jgi:FkbM family methyltransferase
MSRPFALTLIPSDRLRLAISSRLYHHQQSRWLHLYQSASLRYSSNVVMDLVPGDAGSDAIAFTGVYECELTQRVVRLAKHGGLFVDVGANLGYFSLLWASLNPRNRCLAVEAATRNIAFLQRNIEQNHLSGQIQLIPHAAGQIRGTFSFDPGEERQTGWGGFSLECSPRCIEVDVIRLDERIDEPVSLLKIDIEGADTWALFGCERLLKAQLIREIWYEQNKPRLGALGIEPDAAQNYLTSCGYSVRPQNNRNDPIVQWIARISTPGRP